MFSKIGDPMGLVLQTGHSVSFEQHLPQNTSPLEQPNLCGLLSSFGFSEVV